MIQTNENVNENLALLMPAFKQLGIILLSQTIPFLMSLGIKITSLKFDEWIKKLIIKYPKYKGVILIITSIIKDHFKDMSKCNDFISNVEQQKVSKVPTADEIKNEILSLISSEEDKNKVAEFLDLMQSQNFEEKISECIKLNAENIITEELNIEDINKSEKVKEYVNLKDYLYESFK